MSPAAGTTRYLCPLECGWHHDVPPPSPARAAALTALPDSGASDFPAAAQALASNACLAETRITEAALREHLGTHTPEQFARTIHELRQEIAQLKRAQEAPA